MVVPVTSEMRKKKETLKNLPGFVFNINIIPMFEYSQKIFSRL